MFKYDPYKFKDIESVAVFGRKGNRLILIQVYEETGIGLDCSMFKITANTLNDRNFDKLYNDIIEAQKSHDLDLNKIQEEYPAIRVYKS